MENREKGTKGGNERAVYAQYVLRTLHWRRSKEKNKENWGCQNGEREMWEKESMLRSRRKKEIARSRGARAARAAQDAL